MAVVVEVVMVVTGVKLLVRKRDRGRYGLQRRVRGAEKGSGGQRYLPSRRVENASENNLQGRHYR